MVTATPENVASAALAADYAHSRFCLLINDLGDAPDRAALEAAGMAALEASVLVRGTHMLAAAAAGRARWKPILWMGWGIAGWLIGTNAVGCALRNAAGDAPDARPALVRPHERGSR